MGEFTQRGPGLPCGSISAHRFADLKPPQGLGLPDPAFY